MVGFVFATRGIHAGVDQLKRELMSEKFWWKRKNMKTGNWEHVPVTGGLRPIQLWEYFFPSESPTEIGNTKSPMNDNVNEVLYRLGLLGADHYEPKYISKYVRFLGKAMGLKKIPDVVQPKKITVPFHQHGLSIIPIGLKEDEFKVHDFGDAGKYYQEMI